VGWPETHAIVVISEGTVKNAVAVLRFNVPDYRWVTGEPSFCINAYSLNYPINGKREENR
jgi:hypothetical protein